jgi:hypothetical protein
MLRRSLRVRQMVPLAVAVFVIGAGAGALAVAALHDSRRNPKRASILVKATPKAGRPRARVTRPISVTKRHPASNAPEIALVPTDASASFSGLEANLPGQVGLAVAPLGTGEIQTFGDVQTAHAWSTSKVPVLVTLLANDERTNTALSPEQRNYAALALEQSDNAAIEALFSELESVYGGLIPASEAVQQVLRDAGDHTTTINTAPNDEGFTTYGQTEWSTMNETIFYRALARGCLLDAQDTAYVLGLMRNVVSWERWGVGSAGYPSSVPVAFKGGWGPDGAGKYQVRQTAIIGSGNHGYVLSMLALPASGTFTDGTTMITELASWARQHLVEDAPAPPASCQGSR